MRLASYNTALCVSGGERARGLVMGNQTRRSTDIGSIALMRAPSPAMVSTSIDGL